ncbi:hypothetical protein [Arthrobacter sp. JSM 101049]|uniref:hypothetical protein n=1 Tax=Arthrobacter sp. JSM 101049 TaxID=929097 RepID=UPI00356785A8
MCAGPDEFRHSARSIANRQTKAKALARFLWDRHLGSEELDAYSPAELRAIARAAGVSPPSTMDTWRAAAELLAAQDAWLSANPAHQAGARNHVDDAWKWEPGFKS